MSASPSLSFAPIDSNFLSRRVWASVVHKRVVLARYLAAQPVEADRITAGAPAACVGRVAHGTQAAVAADCSAVEVLWIESACGSWWGSLVNLLLSLLHVC